MLKAPTLEVTIHPSDIAVVGTKEAVARARAAVADRLTDTEAYMTAAKEAQEIEDALRALRVADDRDAAAPILDVIDERLASLVVPHEEWEVLYRQRLQVERDLLRSTREPAAKEEEPGIVERIVESVANIGR